MMKTAVFFFCLSLGMLAQAQGNLQFNQIVTVSNTLQTVPAAKAWKVEAYLESEVFISGSNTVSCPTSHHRPLVINGNNYYFTGALATGSGSVFAANGNRFPIWLKAGDQIRTTCSSDFASIIEFNIVP